MLIQDFTSTTFSRLQVRNTAHIWGSKKLSEFPYLCDNHVKNMFEFQAKFDLSLLKNCLKVSL